MTANTASVVERATEVVAATRDGAAWLDANNGRLQLPKMLAHSFRKFARRAQRLRVAAERPACVAVFGASQAGKSYLVSGMATRAGHSLTAVYGKRQLNFLRDLNPQGEKESTGLVSRFTVRAISAPADLPVPLRLLSQTDVVKIVANAFLEDFRLDDLDPPTSEAVTALFDRLEAQAGPQPQGALIADDIEEMREYFELHFRSHAMIQGLGVAYWERAAELIPRLPPPARAEAYSPLWNGIKAFTRIVRDLIGALANLNFPDTAFCGLDALMPRETGVLNADTVFSMGDGKLGTVRVASPTGTTTLFDRSLLAALIAEITVPLAEQPWDYFEHTDLLDFPGARSREVIKDAISFLSEPGKLGRVFLRGKVAYLFQRYNAEQEIAAMLLCVGPSVQDVQTLPEMVANWINHTIGATPSARAQQRNSLFLVLTKFDMEFVEKEGEDVGSGQRWTTRLQASLLDFFAKAYDWPNFWTPGRAFDNSFWLRSTAVGFSGVFDYTEPAEPGGQRIEVWAPRADTFVAPRFTAYEANESVRTYFSDPTRAWQEALKPNDGGISYLAGSLAPICDPTLKATQIASRIEELAGEVGKQLRPYFHTGDLAAELTQARQNARELLRSLVACAQAQMLGPLLRSLQVTQDQVASVYWRLQSQPDEAPLPVGTTSLADDYMNELGDMLAAEPTAVAPVARDRFERFAEMAIEEWLRTMTALSDDPATDTVFRLPGQQAIALTGEIARAARRLALRDQIATALRERASFQHRSVTAAQKPIVIVEQAINGFVYLLGFDRIPPEQRPAIPNGSRTIFAPRAPVAGLPALGPTPTPYDRTFHVDWMTAIARVFEDNVQDASSSTIDIAANAALERILQRLGA